ncbi:MAG: DUF5799 family protein [Halorientalis sp.]
MTDHWTDHILGDRMTVDQEFADRVAQSQFTHQQWGLLMTAVEFAIEDPDDSEQATLVADTSDLPDVVPELDAMDQSPAAMTGRGAGSEGEGIVATLKGKLGLAEDDDGVDEEAVEAAEKLADEYAELLQRHLEERGKWAEVRDLARQ